jgi:hypothetical protein
MNRRNRPCALTRYSRCSACRDEGISTHGFFRKSTQMKSLAIAGLNDDRMGKRFIEY